MHICVVGGGFGGLAAAARLAKMGHKVTLVERRPRLGGALSTLEAGGFTWDAGPNLTLLPAVIRDLFRKTGRPLERSTELEPVPVLRSHRFEDKSSLLLPGGSRADQQTAFDQLSPGLGGAWTAHVDAYADIWEILRKDFYERPWAPDVAPAELNKLLNSRQSLHKLLRSTFSDTRLRAVAAYPFAFDGHDLRNVPAWAGFISYLEQRLGGWKLPGHMAELTTLLTQRLETRGVTVLTDTNVDGLILSEGRAVGVRTTAGEIDADAVVVAIDARRIPELARHVERTMPAIPPVISHLGLEGELPELEAPEVVLHGDPMLVIRQNGTAPEGMAAWTVYGRGRLAEDMLYGLARHKLDLRDNIAERIDRSPRELVEAWGGSPHGVLWQGRGTVRQRIGPTTPIPGVYVAGAHTSAGSGLPFVGMSAAQVAHEIGPAR